jgi:hypothetical protein
VLLQPVSGEKTSDPRTGCVGDYKLLQVRIILAVFFNLMISGQQIDVNYLSTLCNLTTNGSLSCVKH